MDATYARLYDLTRDELRYILDPKEVHGDDFPGDLGVPGGSKIPAQKDKHFTF